MSEYLKIILIFAVSLFMPVAFLLLVCWGA